MESLYGLVTIIAPIMLATALPYGIITDRRRSRAQRGVTGCATREQYERPGGGWGNIKNGR